MDDGGSYVALMVQVIQRVGNLTSSLQQLRVGEGGSTEKSLSEPRLHLVLRQHGVQRATSEVLEYDEAPRRSARSQYLQMLHGVGECAIDRINQVTTPCIL